MAENKLEIVLTAETEAATKAIQNATKSLATLDKTAKSSKGLDAIGKSAANATPALTNFGRVVQDAPFGIIGIANNIDPLISSFQALKTQTGSTGGALKALLAGLTGPAGIAIGISAVTSAAIAFGPQIGNFISGLVGTKKSADDASGSLKKLGESVAQELVQFQSLLSFAQDGTKGYIERKKAVDELKKSYPEYLGQLSDEAILSGKATAAGDAYIDSLLRQAVVKALKEDIAALVAERAKEIIAIQKSAIEYEKEAKSQEERKKAFEKNKVNLKEQIALSNAAGKATGDLSAAFSQQKIAIEDAYATRPEEKIKNIKEELKAQVQTIIDAAGSFSELTDVTNKNTAATTSATNAKTENKDAIVDWLKWADEEIARQRELAQAALARAAAERDAARSTAAQAAIKAAPTTAPENLTQSATVQLAAANVQILQAAAVAAADAALQQERLNTATQNTNVAFALLSPAIDQAFNALANGENATEAIGQAIKQLIVQLVKAVVQAAILAAVLNAISGGTASGGEGFFSIFKGLLGFRANGGPVGAGSPYIVGENGPELFVPSSQGNIVPNMALAAAGGTLTARISGNDLLFILNNAGRNRQTNFG